MASCWATGLLWLLMLATAQPYQQPSSGSQQPSVDVRLSTVLGPVVEGAVLRAVRQSGWDLSQLAGRLQRLQGEAGAGQRALVETTRQQARLDAFAQDVEALQLAVFAGGGRGGINGTCGACPSPQPETEQEQTQESTCQNQPTPVPAGRTAGQKLAVRACARSCQQLRDQHQDGTLPDGPYWLTGLPVPVFCDFSHDGGGWTLLLTAVSRRGWDPLSVLRRNEHSPTLTDDYSILQYANAIRNLGTGDRFAYRIETQAEKGRQRLGGIWFAPRGYSFVDETGTQTNVSLVRRFENWTYKADGIKRRMPWINTGGQNPYKMFPVLTTASPTQWWGTLVTHHSHTTHNHSPWHNPQGFHSGNVLYWMREDEL